MEINGNTDCEVESQRSRVENQDFNEIRKIIIETIRRDGGVYTGVYVSSKHRIGVFFFEPLGLFSGRFRKPTRTHLGRRRPVRVDW